VRENWRCTWTCPGAGTSNSHVEVASQLGTLQGRGQTDKTRLYTSPPCPFTATMSCTLQLEKIRFFYAIGNSPAVSLTDHLPRGQKADLLLLGCGDVRNILFTVFSESPYLDTGADSVRKSRMLVLM